MIPGRIIKKLIASDEAMKGRRVRFPANVKDGGFYRSAIIAGVITGFGFGGQVNVKGDNGLTYAVASDRVELI